MNILIFDDEIKNVTSLQLHIEQYMNQNSLNYSIDTATDPDVILNNNKSYNLAFLDIYMNGPIGLRLAEELKKRNSKVLLFFVTAFNAYHDEAFDLHAFRYFSKPFDSERLYSGLDKAMEYINEAYTDIYILNGNEHLRILTDDIIYIRREGRISVIKTKTEKYSSKKELNEWEREMPNTFFYRIHNSFLINMHYIDSCKYTEVYMTDGTRFSVAPKKQKNFRKFWFEYLGRR